jgi:beta-1,4-mannosyl-glycoprotein beta-1,4-N-acetylglucosaminyltransferase
LKIFDAFLFFNELDLLEIRLNTLADTVDFFVITEARVTFSGIPKKLFYDENKERFAKFHSQIIHNIIDEIPKDFDLVGHQQLYFTDRFKSYPHKSAGVPLFRLSLDFQREVYQRDSIINGLLGSAKSDDLIIISDLDEIPNPEAVQSVAANFVSGQIYNFCQKWYMYYLNVFNPAEWFGTRICNFETLLKHSVDLMRHHLESREEQPGPIVESGGWHFSFLGGQEAVIQKLKAYSYQGRRSAPLLRILDTIFPSRINRKIQNNEDIFSTGRRFLTIPIDDSFPQYICMHQDSLRRYIKPWPSK